MAFRANNELQQMVTRQFNAQQLTLARKIAQDIESHFRFLETALFTYSSHTQETDLQKKSDYFYQVLKDWQVLALGMIHENTPDVFLASSPDFGSFSELGIEFSQEDLAEHFSSNQQSLFYYSRIVMPASGHFENTNTLVLAARSMHGRDAPVIEKIPDEQRVTFFIVDVQEITRRYAHGVVSGKTGYPWVIDDRGYFIYHVEKDFVGRDSTIVRRERNPDISYQRINEITRNNLLQGKEGTDWYISGWHWDVISEMKKLLAYSPIRFSPDSPRESSQYVWSVGLAAPETEVYGLIQPIVIRQWSVVGLFLIIIVSGLLTLYIISLRWSQVLAGKVEEKTKHLVKSQDLLRREKEKVEMSLQALVDAQQKLVRSERFAAIGEAASHLSHEIKNPLMLMSGFANQVMRTLPEDDPNREKLNIISGEAKRLENMLNQVRDFTRPQLPRKEKHQINDLIHETLKLVRNELNLARVNLDINLSSEVPETYFDQAQIKQVLINLIKNAWEAIPDGGKISITTGQDKDRIMVSVTDTGAGIARSKLKDIFSPFFTTKDKGTGLGLAVLYRIIQDHQGDVTVDSEPGKGSRFTFYLPLN